MRLLLIIIATLTLAGCATAPLCSTRQQTADPLKEAAAIAASFPAAIPRPSENIDYTNEKLLGVYGAYMIDSKQLGVRPGVTGEAYYRALYHESAHSSMGPLGRKPSRDDGDYAAEEVRAECASAILSAEAGLEGAAFILPREFIKLPKGFEDYPINKIRAPYHESAKYVRWYLKNAHLDPAPLFIEGRQIAAYLLGHEPKGYCNL